MSAAPAGCHAVPCAAPAPAAFIICSKPLHALCGRRPAGSCDGMKASLLWLLMLQVSASCLHAGPVHSSADQLCGVAAKPFQLSLCGATSLTHESVSALLRLPVLTDLRIDGCPKIQALDKMRLIAKVRARSLPCREAANQVHGALLAECDLTVSSMYQASVVWRPGAGV